MKGEEGGAAPERPERLPETQGPPTTALDDPQLRERLLQVARRVLGPGSDAEDVVQDALLQAETQASDARSRRAWLFAVTQRRAIDRLRRREREERALAGAAARAAGRPESASAPDQAARREELERLRAALGQVREPFQSALRLRYLEQLGFPAVARRLEVGERTARSRVARGLALLREVLRGEA
ncbi:MAG TPA: hypothetical protein DEA08_24705 [Planctomycetes bacterium]|nr:hypothetical protein [Planctomycetota bacterium]